MQQIMLGCVRTEISLNLPYMSKMKSPFRSYIAPILPSCINSINLEEQDMGDRDTRLSIKMLNGVQVNDSKLQM